MSCILPSIQLRDVQQSSGLSERLLAEKCRKQKVECDVVKSVSVP